MFPTDINFSEMELNAIVKTVEAVTGTETDTLGKSLKFDYESNSFVFLDGSNVIPSDTEAIAQWIELFIRTEINKYAIYSDSFGLDLSDLVGYRLPRSFQVAEIQRRLTEGILKKCPKAQSVHSWSFDAGHFSFAVTTEKGEEINIYV